MSQIFSAPQAPTRSGTEIKALYEAQAQTNPFDDGEKAKLGGVPLHFDSVQDVWDRAAGLDVGDTFFAKKENIYFEVVSSGHHWITDGGMGVKVIPMWVGANGGIYNALGFRLAADGVTDDIAKINVANEAADGATLFFPGGVYAISEAYVIGRNVSVIGAGPKATKFKPLNAGVGVQIHKPLPANGDAYSRRYADFGIQANANTTYGFWVMRSIYCKFENIEVTAPAANLNSGFVGFRVSGAVYQCSFRNCIFDTEDGQTHATVGKGWHIGNGYNEVGNINADTNANTFETCRAVRIPIGMDIDAAMGNVFITPDLENGATANILIRGDYNKFVGAWTEDGTIVVDAYTRGDGAGGIGAPISPIGNELQITFPAHLNVNKCRSVSIHGSSINDMTIGAGANLVDMVTSRINGALVNDGRDCNLNYHKGEDQFRVVQRGTDTVINEVAQSGSTLLGLNNGQSIRSNTFGALEIDSNGRGVRIPSSFVEIEEISDPGSAGADGCRIFAIDSGGKTQLVAKFSSGLEQVLAIEP